jgi:transaldolase
MTLFQWITIPSLLVVIVMTAVAMTRARLTPRIGLAWIALWMAALLAIAFPGVPMLLAHLLGIGRGTDLVMYVAILFTFLGFFLLYLRYRRVTEQLTEIVRHLAIAEALPPQVRGDLSLMPRKDPMTAPRRIQLYSDGADVREMASAREAGIVRGFTTNPTLMRKSGVSDYEAFAREALAATGGLPISFEVFADEFQEMERQAKLIAAWGDAVYVKIPITNTAGESSIPLIRRLANARVKMNVTAILTLDQVRAVVDALDSEVPAIVSVFAGRIADTGRDPVPLMREAAAIVAAKPLAQLLWASPRELLNVFQAEETGCHIITVTPDLLKKMSMVGKPLDELSLDTVKMFYNDASAAGYRL